MKKVIVAGLGAIGAGILRALAHGGYPAFDPRAETEAVRKPARLQRRRVGQQLRDPVDPRQAERIFAAMKKRIRRAEKLGDHTSRAVYFNRCIQAVPFAHTLNPFYIAK